MIKANIRFKRGSLTKMHGNLDRFIRQSKYRVMSKAGNYAATPGVKAARAKAPGGPTGNLKKSLATQQGKKTRSRKAFLKVIKVIGPAWPLGAHAHLVEYGHKGGAKPKPFMRPAWDNNKATVKTRFREKMSKELKAETAKFNVKF